MRHLPAFRFKTYCAPFSSVALDFFGLLKIKKTRNVVINGSCLVIVCNTTRVIHLEITETQSTNDFLLAWRRFINKRGLWEHAIVEKTLPGRDGLVRKVELRLSGQRNLTRPIHKLCLIATVEELNST